MLLRSLLCTQGHDNGPRLLALSCVSYFLTTLAASIHTNLGLVLGLVLILFVTLSSLRRIRDTASPYWMVLLVILPLALFVLLLNLDVSVLLLVVNAVLGIALSSFVAGLKSTKAREYSHGYQGPAQDEHGLSRTVKARVEPNVRIEPMLSSYEQNHHESHLEASTSGVKGGNPSSSITHGLDSAHSSYSESKHFDSNNIESESGDGKQEASSQPSLESKLNELLATWSEFASKQKLWLGVSASVLVVVCLVVALWFDASSTDMEADVANQEASQDAVESNKLERVQVKLPDGFALVLESNHLGEETLVMRWLGDEGVAERLWSLADARGDKRCAHLTFNDGSQYRPMQVDLLADSATEARFTPLDTQKIIKDMARRGSVKLCGYNFSLKGSQAALGRELKFADILGS